MAQQSPLQPVYLRRAANPTQPNVYDRLLDPSHFTGTYAQRFAEFSHSRRGGRPSFTRMMQRRLGARVAEEDERIRFKNNLRYDDYNDPRTSHRHR